jgi:Flp pilus assembly protein protease CpaA
METTGLIEDAFLHLALVSLLVVAAAQDLKTKEVSNWLTLFPLVISVVWRTVTGSWITLIAFVIIALFSERIVCQGRGMALAGIGVGFLVILFLPDSPAYWIIFGWLAAWLLWEFNVIGGADVKLMMLLLAIFPDPRMFFLILLAKLVAGLTVPAVLYGRHAAKCLFSAAFSVLATHQLPDRETLEQEGLPAAFVYTMAGTAYLIVFTAHCPIIPTTNNGALFNPYAVEIGDPVNWGILALAFIAGTIPIALYLRRNAHKHPAAASPHNPINCTGQNIKHSDSTPAGHPSEEPRPTNYTMRRYHHTPTAAPTSTGPHNLLE